MDEDPSPCRLAAQPVFHRAPGRWSRVAERLPISSEVGAIHSGEFVKQRNYNQARRQKEESRKARQQQKLQRKLGRTTALHSGDSGDSSGVSGVTEASPEKPAPPNDPARASSS